MRESMIFYLLLPLQNFANSFEILNDPVDLKQFNLTHEKMDFIVKLSLEFDVLEEFFLFNNIVVTEIEIAKYRHCLNQRNQCNTIQLDATAYLTNALNTILFIYQLLFT
ncbi:hypothetical protein RF11_09863 [Thelohanellus kitauei]|uniref:Uncharacterized protein n=1 Tax=Thelohanellus kitauei TaxID=669202 RepID=A0A0C2M2F3_THEKT|nr:hypothetical protein RF11_09863 [Thelohanellus kitauei]